MVISMLTLMIYGLMDYSAFINANQTVQEAARQGARCAARSETRYAGDVANRAITTIALYFRGTQADKVVVQLEDGQGNPIANPKDVARGQPIRVRVGLPYSACTSFAGIFGVSDRNLEAFAVMRRE